jgi:branched-chain amino acid transport system ATP-binding protein
VLEISEVTVRYGALEAVRGASLAAAEGEFVAVVGANGAGKTTLMKTVSGLLSPCQGSITFAGRRIDGRPPHEICGLGLTHVPEGRKLFPHMTVVENLRMGALLPVARAEQKESMARVFTLFPRLRERPGQLAGTLSGGEQQMLALGRGLMARPRLLILDEPTLGLSPKLAAQILDAVKRLNVEQGLGVLVVSQEIMRVLQLADRAYVFENGHVALSGPAREVAENTALRMAYLGR